MVIEQYPITVYLCGNNCTKLHAQFTYLLNAANGADNRETVHVVGPEHSMHTMLSLMVSDRNASAVSYHHALDYFVNNNWHLSAGKKAAVSAEFVGKPIPDSELIKALNTCLTVLEGALVTVNDTAEKQQPTQAADSDWSDQQAGEVKEIPQFIFTPQSDKGMSPQERLLHWQAEDLRCSVLSRAHHYMHHVN